MIIQTYYCHVSHDIINQKTGERMIKEIEAKQILTTCKNPSMWFGVKYNFNVYRGCEFQCIYCDSRSKCYCIENFKDILVKINSVELLKKELKSKRKKGTVGTGAMSDPYIYSEKKFELTRKSLEVIAEYRFPVHITTKSNLVLRDIDLLEEINRIYASVSITVTTTDDNLAKIIEPNAPLPTERLKALGILSSIGICTSITMMPILPFIEDNEQNILDIVKKADYYGVRHIVPAIGMTLREGNREYYYDKLDEHFPGLREKYEKKYGSRYSCTPSNSKKLWNTFNEACYKYGISTKMPSYENKVTAMQISMFEGK